MAKKQKSFAEKASSSKGKDLVHVKFVKSVPSDKEGFWRFNESMIGLEKGQQLDAALKQMEDEANLVDIDMPSAEPDTNQATAETETSVDQENLSETTPAEEEAPVEEETPAEEEAPAEEETPAEEEAPTQEEAPAEEKSPAEEESDQKTE